MTDVTADLRAAFEEAGYTVDDVTTNRRRIRVSLREDAAPADEVRRLTDEVCGPDAVVGFDVTSEATAGDTAVGTVVSFRHRP